METFVFEKANEFYLPESYDRYEKIVTGMFTRDSVRFYKKALENIITYESIMEKNPGISHEEIRYKLRLLFSILESFRIDEVGLVQMRVDSFDVKDRFRFSKGMILVKGDSFIDVTNKDLLKDYLANYGFNEEAEETILKNKVTTLHRIPSKKLHII